ncbi:MAG: hypothetical protein A2V90_06340 [Gammaproteobacteria bacterium RBG_16_57_12]|nr:MAG: hypothetical protein A2V90_06340 [Gammaproteobacteria bacterium RBG_16_57_12]
MLARITKEYFHNQTCLYEGIYARLQHLLCNMQDAPTGACYAIGSQIGFRILERHKYTTILLLTIRMPAAAPLIPDLEMGIRLYHDAGVAEVQSYQNNKYIQPDYDYPNPRMHQPDEKHQVNRLLYEWLDYCLRQGRRLPASLSG